VSFFRDFPNDISDDYAQIWQYANELICINVDGWYGADTANDIPSIYMVVTFVSKIL